MGQTHVQRNMPALLEQISEARLQPELIISHHLSLDGGAHGYLAEVNWESADRLEARAACLLPALLLARVDGKSPVEYISRDDTRTLVRDVSSILLRTPVERLSMVEGLWLDRLRHLAG